MTYPVWPIDKLPWPKQDGFRRERGDGRTGFRNDRGPPSLRELYSSTTTLYTVALLMTRQELGYLDEFIDVDLADETMFVMPDPLFYDFAILEPNGDWWVDENGDTLLYGDTMLVAFAPESLPTDGVQSDEGYTTTFRLLRYPTV